MLNFSPITLVVKLHSFTLFHRKIMYEICGEKKQLFAAYLTFFSNFSSTRAPQGTRGTKIYVLANSESRIFSVRVPAPPYIMHPQLQRTCHRIVNHYVKIWHVRLGGGGGGGANNMHPLNWGGAQTKTNKKDPGIQGIFSDCKKSSFFNRFLLDKNDQSPYVFILVLFVTSSLLLCRK